jgi:hypothetical protein
MNYADATPQTQIEDAVAARMKSQNAKQHYEKKLAEEQTKVREAEEVGRILQDEFMVSV